MQSTTAATLFRMLTLLFADSLVYGHDRIVALPRPCWAALSARKTVQEEGLAVDLRTA